jgi:hypothetical protein
MPANLPANLPADVRADLPSDLQADLRDVYHSLRHLPSGLSELARPVSFYI